MWTGSFCLMVLLVICILLAATEMVTAAGFSPSVAVIECAKSDEVLQYASRELRQVLNATTELAVLDAPAGQHSDYWLFRLKTDSSLKPTTFAVRASNTPINKALVVELAGHDSTCVLHAVYTMLARAGVLFNVTGTVLPDKLELNKVLGWQCEITPTVAQRGIRLHINFPMDISSYPVWEAKNYIRNLARLRFNKIVFHSYPGMFYETPNGSLAGGFFYGQNHPIPNDPGMRKVIRNEKMFCIPEIEPVYEDSAAKSKAAMRWLTEVIRQAKECGMTVQFSCEPGAKDSAETAEICKAILEQYPAIDVLEMITSENFGNPEETLGRYFGAVDVLRADLGSKCPKLTVGVYETGSTLKGALEYMRAHSPKDIAWTFMPAHGARAVAAALKTMEVTGDDWKRMGIHSWVEFDGLMYCQQNSLIGAKQLVDLAESKLGGAQIPAIDFNHWRTAENRTSIQYAAELCVNGKLTPAEFYKQYASELKLGKAAEYSKAMSELDDLDTFCRDNLFNLGFCYYGCWINPSGLGWTRGWSAENIEKAAKQFDLLREKLNGCLKGTKNAEGREYLRFLMNRMECTELHLRSVENLAKLHSICDDSDPAKLDAAGRKLVDERCNDAMSLAHRYIDLHSQMMPDRGCEGTLISYYHTIVEYIKHIRRVFLNDQSTAIFTDDGSNGPPAPGDSSRS